MKILMVCLGNICRSPLAEGILKHKVQQHKLDWFVDSAGTANYHEGEAPHRLSQKIAKQNGIDISKQCCRQFRKEDMLQFDKIYVMDSHNYADVKRTAAELWDNTKVDLILNEIHPGKNMSVPDPWYGGEDGYIEVYNLLDEACERIIEKLKA